MSARLGVVVRCGDAVHRLYETVTSVARQSRPAGQIALVADRGTPAAVLPWLEAFGAARDLRVVVAAEATAAARNAIARDMDVDAIAWLDAGELLDRDALDEVARAFSMSPAAGLVLSGVTWIGPGAERRSSEPPAWTVPAIAADSTLPGLLVTGTQAWRESGGFDESLDALDRWEWLLRAVVDGREAAVVPRGVLVRAVRKGELYRAEWDVPSPPAFAAIVARHAGALGRHVADVLHAREIRLQGVASRYRELIARHEAARMEAETCQRALEEARAAAAPLPELAFADLERATPVSRHWGYDRGTPVDRPFIERFLAVHADDVRGRVLEVQEAGYTRRFGGDRVTHSDVVDVNAGNPGATIVSDLRAAANLPDAAYDCVIITQTIHVIDDMAAVAAECARVLRPGGVLLATLPAASRVCVEYGVDGDFWRVTEAGARRLFSQAFSLDHLDVASHGTVLATAAFLYGAAAEELPPGWLEGDDPYFPLIVSVRAVKAAPASPRGTRAGREPVGSGILLYHRVSEPETDVHGMAVPPAEFEAQLAHLRAHYDVVPVARLAEAARRGDVPAGAVALAFDDGYEDNLLVASPLVEAAGLPATFFLTTRALDEAVTYWWDELEHALLAPGPAWPPTLDVTLPGGTRRFACATAEDRLAAHAELYAVLIAAAEDVRAATLERLRRWRDGSAANLPRRLDGAGIEALAARPRHDIGAHTVTHPVLPDLDAATQARELGDSRAALSARLGRSIDGVAYPYGAWSEETARIARAAGYRFALTCDQGAVTGASDPLQLPRLDVGGRRGAPFEAWLASRLVRTPLPL